jgi:hypothetical protein
MPPVVSALLAFVVALCRSRASLCLENLALRHQVAIYKQTVSRPRLRPSDRLLWGWLSRLWSGWQEALAFVQPRTVMAWQRKRFREHWRRLSQRGIPGRPALAKEVRDLIRQMWQANPTQGLAPDCRSTPEARHRSGEIDGGEVSPTTQATTVPYMEDLSEEPPAEPRRLLTSCSLGG